MPRNRAGIWLRTSPVDEYRFLCAGRLNHLVEVRQPLALVPVPIARLLDGHPECHVHPGTVPVDRPVDLGAPDAWFAQLYEPPRGLDGLPFLFSTRLQRKVFDACVGAWRIERERDVLDAYLTSCFNAWLDNHNLYTGPKKVVVAALPGPVDAERFAALYPDGLLLEAGAGAEELVLRFGLAGSPAPLEPTFNGLPVRAA